jgi:hypothetical protein
MSRQYWVSPLPPFHTADGPTVGAAAALTDGSPTPSIIIPAGTLESGSRLEFSAFGRFTSTATPGTIVAGVYLSASGAAIGAGQALCTTSALTPQASQTNRSWRLEVNAAVRAVGTAGSLLGLLELTNVTTGLTDLGPATAPTAVAYDTTVPLTVRLGLTPSVTTGTWVVHYLNARLVN